ncbi:hypothetical protein M3J09_007951 [Ascochyta lentis]
MATALRICMSGHLIAWPWRLGTFRSRAAADDMEILVNAPRMPWCLAFLSHIPLRRRRAPAWRPPMRTRERDLLTCTPGPDSRGECSYA